MEEVRGRLRCPGFTCCASSGITISDCALGFNPSVSSRCLYSFSVVLAQSPSSNIFLDETGYHYTRTLADLSCFGQRVCWLVQVRRFFCRNPCCEQKFFAERLPTCWHFCVFCSSKVVLRNDVGGEFDLRAVHPAALHV